MPSLSEVISRLTKILKEVEKLAVQCRFSRTDRQQIVAAALLATVIEEARAISRALSQQEGSTGFILLRSLLEAYVDLLNLLDNPQYVDFMDAAFLDQQERILKNVVERGSRNVFLAGIAADPSAPAQLSGVRSQLAQLKARGVEPLSVWARFKQAGQLDYYEGPYANLCWYSHNNINVLQQRHLRNSRQGTTIVVFAPPREEDVQILADTAAGVAANSVAAVKELLEKGPPSGLQPLTDALGQLRATWKA